MQDPNHAPSTLHTLAERRLRRIRAGGALTTLVTLCAIGADANGATPTAADTARVIVRFAPEVVDAGDPAFLSTLAASARVGRIELIRPMSGDSYVMRIVCDGPAHPGADACEAAMARIRAAGPVLMIEPDGRETTR